MDDSTGQKRGKVPLKHFLKDLRSDATDQELMRRYELNAQAFVSLIKALLQKRYITPNDLARRKEINVKRDLERESEFLATLYICPNCGHPHPGAFNVCPACGVHVEDLAHPEEVLVATSTFAEGIAVNELPKLPTNEPHVPAESVEEVVVEYIEEVDEDEAGRKLRGSDKKSSAIDSVRSFLSKKLKRD
jgi:hypothetical protein